MDPYGQISALERHELKRYPTDIANIPDRGTAPVSYEEIPAPSFAEVAARVTNEPPPEPKFIPDRKPVKPERTFSLWEKTEMSFGDFVDIINPLQHIPIVATIYRNMTGDAIGMVPRVIGGALWGRIGGFVAGVVNAFVDWFTGKDIGDHVYAVLFGEPAKPGNRSSVAQTTVPSRAISPSEASEKTVGRAIAHDYKIDPPAQRADQFFSKATSVPTHAPVFVSTCDSTLLVALNKYQATKELMESETHLGVRFQM